MQPGAAPALQGQTNSVCGKYNELQTTRARVSPGINRAHCFYALAKKHL